MYFPSLLSHVLPVELCIMMAEFAFIMFRGRIPLTNSSFIHMLSGRVILSTFRRTFMAYIHTKGDNGIMN